MINMKIRLVLFLLFIGLEGFSQNQEMDSLYNVLQTTNNDSLKMEAYLKLGVQWENINSDTALNYYQQATAYARNYQWWKRAGDIYLNQSFLFNTLRDSSSLKKVSDSALFCYKKADYLHGQINTHLNYGTFIFNVEDFYAAIDAFEKAKALAINAEEPEFLARIYNNIGLAYQYVDNYEKALENHLNGLKIKEEHQFASVEYSYINVAVAYHVLNDNKNAITYYRKAKLIAQEKDKQSVIALVWKNIGDVYFDLNKIDSSAYYFNQSIALYKELNLPDGLGNAYLSLANLKKRQGNYSQALSLVEQSLKLFEQHGSQKQLSFIYLSLADIEQQLAKKSDSKTHLEKAKNWGEKGYALATAMGLKVRQNNIARLLAEVYHSLGNDTKGFQYAQQAIQLTDSIFTTEKTEAVSRAMTEFETERKELKISLMTEEAKNKDLELSKSESERKKQTNFLITIGIVLILSVGVIVILVVFYRQKQQSNALLKEHNLEIEKQNEEKALLLKEIHHRVKNNLQVVSSLLDMQSMGLNNEAAKLAVNDGQNRVKAMALIHEKLYQTDDIIHLNFKDYVIQLMCQIAAVYPESQNIEQLVEADDIQLDIDTAVPLGLILSELITNGYKYAFKGQNAGFIKIGLQLESAGQYIMTVADNGSGLPNDFDITKAKSLGLKLVRRLSKQLYGSVEYFNDGGAVFVIRFMDTIERKTVE